MNLVAVFFLLVTFKMTAGVEEKVQDEPNPDIITLIKKILKRLDNMDQRFEDMDQRSERRFDAVNERLGTIDKRFDAVDARLKPIGKRFDAVDKRLDAVDKQFDTVGKRFDTVDKRVDAVDKRLDAVEVQLKEVVRRSTADEQEIDANTKSVQELSTVISTNLHNISKDVKDVKEVLTEVLPGKSERKPADSCSWLQKHSYCIRSGQYWIKDKGSTSLKYCKMDDQPVTTTVSPTTSVSTTEQPTTRPPTTTPVHPAASCKEVKEREPHSKSGLHELTIGGKKFEAYCDMEVDGGGWTMVGRAVVKREEDAADVDMDKIQSDDYSQLAKVTTGRYLLSTTGLNTLYDLQPFTEVRFNCYKHHHKRRLHLKTTNNDTLQWLLRRRSRTPYPRACGSYMRLQGDTSYLASHCQQWWGDGTWYLWNIYDRPMAASDESGREYILSLDYREYSNHVHCDDHRYKDPHYSNVGEWSWFVR